MNFDNHITGRNIADDPNSPYYMGKDYSKAIFCPICRKYYLDSVEVNFEDSKGLLCDEELCENCAYYQSELENEMDKIEKLQFIKKSIINFEQKIKQEIPPYYKEFGKIAEWENKIKNWEVCLRFQKGRFKKTAKELYELY